MGENRTTAINVNTFETLLQLRKTLFLDLEITDPTLSTDQKQTIFENVVKNIGILDYKLRNQSVITDKLFLENSYLHKR